MIAWPYCGSGRSPLVSTRLICFGVPYGYSREHLFELLSPNGNPVPPYTSITSSQMATAFDTNSSGILSVLLLNRRLQRWVRKLNFHNSRNKWMFGVKPELSGFGELMNWNGQWTLECNVYLRSRTNRCRLRRCDVHSGLSDTNWCRRPFPSDSFCNLSGSVQMGEMWTPFSALTFRFAVIWAKWCSARNDATNITRCQSQTLARSTICRSMRAHAQQLSKNDKTNNISYLFYVLTQHSAPSLETLNTKL